ncbi:IS1096 element passenger TnpR family protein [Nonomuraea diastatica]|uniref:plasmid pRiA4b ORF-3 family protein n=1 Tax=Nonomuraea diastatica TaxID=1848329 RepID=UPI003CCC54BB
MPSAARLWDLHNVIQIAMGWQNFHLHMFAKDWVEYGDHHSSEYDVTLASLLPDPGEWLAYRYDSGDCWDHDLVVEKIHRSPRTRRRTPSSTPPPPTRCSTWPTPSTPRRRSPSCATSCRRPAQPAQHQRHPRPPTSPARATTPNRSPPTARCSPRPWPWPAAGRTARNGPPGSAPANTPPTCRTRWTASPSASEWDRSGRQCHARRRVVTPASSTSGRCCCWRGDRSARGVGGPGGVAVTTWTESGAIHTKHVKWEPSDQLSQVPAEALRSRFRKAPRFK